MKFCSKETNHNFSLSHWKIKSNRNLLNRKLIFKKSKSISTLKMMISKKFLKKVKRTKTMRKKKKNQRRSRKFLRGKFIPGIKT